MLYSYVSSCAVHSCSQYIATHEWEVRQYLHAVEPPPVVVPARPPCLSEATQTQLLQLSSAVQTTILQQPVVDWAVVSRYVQVHTSCALSLTHMYNTAKDEPHRYRCYVL